MDHPSGGPVDLQENHTSAEPPAPRHQDEEENGQAGELAADGVLMEAHPPRFLSPSALKKHIHIETTKVNNELRTRITKEIRKPGRRTYSAIGPASDPVGSRFQTRGGNARRRLPRLV